MSRTNNRPRMVPGILTSALIGGLALTSGVALTATSGWLIVAASFKPQILTLLAVIVLVRAFGIARPVLRYVERVKSHDAALGYLAEERTRIYQRLIPLTPARLGRRGRGDVLAGVVDDLDDIAYAQVRVVVPLVALAVTGVLAAVLNAVVLYPAALVVLGTVAAATLVGAVDYLVERRTQAAVVAARARVGQLSATITSQADQLRAIGGTHAMLARLTRAERELSVAVSRQSWGRAIGAGLSPVVCIAGGVVMAYVVEPWVAVGLPTPLAALLVLTPVALGEVVGGVPDAVGALARAQAAGRRLDAILDQPPAVAAAVTDAPLADLDETEPGRTRSDEVPSDDEQEHLSTSIRSDKAPSETAGTAGSIPRPEPTPVDGDRTGSLGATAANRGEFLAAPTRQTAQRSPLTLATREVTASWDGRGQALDPTSIEVPPGTTLAINGPNGSGKSTLLAVLARHLDPSSGEYLQRSADATALPLEQSRAGLAVVDDETHVLASSVRENLRFTLPGASDEQVEAALRLAGLGEWLDGLPEGLDTRLGAGGQGVSGGERTRLGIARALLSQRPVMLLDEPVAHLDHPTAVAVLADLREARGDRTIVLVSHRDEGVTDADATLTLTRTPHPTSPQRR